MSEVAKLRARLKAEKEGIKEEDIGERYLAEDVSQFKDCHFCGQSTDAMKLHILKELRRTYGNVSKTCRLLGISRGRFYSWVEHDAEFKFKFEGIKARSR